jgi:predicted AlkP superfamily phosphohydrolase/phosphomutase
VNTRVLLLGLDAAEPELLRRWSASGELRSLRRLIDSGAAGEMATASRQFPDIAFHSVYTGRGPARVGRYFFIQPRRADGRLELLGERLSAGEPFWIEAGRRGRCCVVVDTPKLEPYPPARGVHIVGWGSHGPVGPFTAHPAELGRELLTRYGPHPVGKCDDHGKSAASYRSLRRRLLDGVEARRRLLLHLIRAQPWDLFFAVFAETHCVGHQFWHFYDPSHPLHPRGDGSGLGTAVRDVYAAVDRAVGDLVEAAGPGTQVILFSSQGMRPQYHGRDLLSALLRRWGMGSAQNVSPDAADERSERAPQPLLKVLREAVPLPLQYVVKRRLPRRLADALMTRFMGTVRLDLAARAFQVPNHELNPAVRINLKGRDPFGRVEPGREYEELCAFLTQRLRQLVNPATGRQALADVSVIDELYSGEHRDVLPDLTGYWSSEAPIDALYSPGYGTVLGAHKDYRTGGHGPDGFLVMNPGGEVKGARIVDLAPTVLSLLDVPVASEMEGRTLADGERGRR